MKSYHVKRTDDGVIVEVNEETVDRITTYVMHHDVRHSPTGFEYGYSGSGPSDLARCILLDMGFAPNEVDQFYHAFKLDFISNRERESEGFIIYGDAIQLWWDGRHGRTDI